LEAKKVQAKNLNPQNIKYPIVPVMFQIQQLCILKERYKLFT